MAKPKKVKDLSVSTKAATEVRGGRKAGEGQKDILIVTPVKKP